MTPQSTFMVLAPIADGQEESLRALLASMNREPGMADPNNPLVPFGRFDRLHFARFVILEPRTAGDISVYGLPVPQLPTSLAFLGDCDGPAETFLAELVAEAGPGLCQVFSHCQHFGPGTDLIDWMRRHAKSPAATYVNWIGRTVLQIREEDALRTALVGRLQEMALEPGQVPPNVLRSRLLDFVHAERQAGRLSLTLPEPTPLRWRLRNGLHLVAVPAALLVLLPFLVVASPVLVFMLRSREVSDPEITLRPDLDHLRQLGEIEDHEFTNQFSAMGDAKPSLFRRYLVRLLLWVLDYASRHIYRRGYLTRVQTIHFARWVPLDGGKRLYFASNYDGSVDSYMDDFINKVAWGINLVFGNGLGFPRTAWLLRGGARFEPKYKRFLRRHQLPTAVWYKAYPGLSVADLNRNTLVRQGVDRRAMSLDETKEWLSLL